MKNKKGFAVPGIVVLIVLIVGGIWAYNSFIKGKATPLAATGTPTGQPTPQQLTITEDVTVTVSATDKYTTVSTGGTHAYRLKEDGKWTPIKSVADAGTLTASPGNELMVFFYNHTPTITFSYVSAVETFMIPDKGTYTAFKELCNNDTITVRLFNEEGNLLSSTENETLAAGDTVTLTGDIASGYQNCAPYGGVVIAEYNSSNFDDIILSFNGQSAKKTSTPSFHTVSNTADVTKSYEFPALETNTKVSMSAYLDADDTATAADTDVPLLRFCQYNYYIDENDGGKFKIGAEDENSNRIGDCYEFTLYTD